MFTGIVEEIDKIISAKPRSLAIAANEVLQEIKLGQSVAVNGVCLTITSFDASSFSVDIMPETLRRTNLGLLSAGDKVNLERPLTLSDRLGGHLVQGHIDGTGKVVAITRNEEILIRSQASSEILRYVVEKGFIAVDGVSLTVVTKDRGSFQVSIVDYTLKHTTLGERRVGDLVNLEADIIAKYVEQLSQARSSGVTADFLKEHGFLVS